MDKMDKLVMVVVRDVLFAGYTYRFNGFSGTGNFLYVIDQWHSFRRRGDMEIDPRYKQIIPYCAIVHPETKKVFAYQRSDNPADYTEGRLAGNWSWGLGGHIHPEDKVLGIDPLLVNLERELKEETNFDGSFTPVHAGYINDDIVPENSPAGKVPVGQVHFGVFYVIHYDGKPENLRVRSEAKHGEWLNYAELEEIALKNPKVDSWSKIALAPLKDLLR